MRELIFISSLLCRKLFEQHNQFLKMNLKEEFAFLRNLGLRVTVFGKDLNKFHAGSGDCNIFVVVTRPRGDELCYPDTLPEGDMSRLRNWIRCGDPTGLLPEWREVNVASCKMKAYLAGEDPGIDCTSVMDKLFANEGGKNHTYAFSEKTKSVVRITHPHDLLSLRITSLPLLKSEKLSVI